MQQLSFFDILEPIQVQPIVKPGEDIIKKGDTVKIAKSLLDSETLNYFEYYKPVALRSPGVVVDVLSSSFKVIYKTGEEIEIEKIYVKKEH